MTINKLSVKLRKQLPPFRSEKRRRMKCCLVSREMAGLLIPWLFARNRLGHVDGQLGQAFGLLGDRLLRDICHHTRTKEFECSFAAPQLHGKIFD